MRAPRRILLALYVASALLEAAVTLALFLTPERAAEAFGIASTPDTMRLGFFTAFLMLFLTASCGVVIWQLVRTPDAPPVLAGALGAVWFCMGTALFARFGERQYLVLDTTRGALMVALAFADARASRR